MSTIRNIRLVTFCLIVVNGVLAFLVSVAWRSGQARVQEPERLTVASLAMPDLAVMNSIHMPSVDVATLRDQALFHASRSFYQPPPKSAEIPAPNYDLAGTMRLMNGTRLAFVRNRSDQTSRTMHVGDDLDGWRVRAVEADRIVIDHNGQNAELTNAKSSSSLGLIRGPATPRIAQTGIRVLGSAGSPTSGTAARGTGSRATAGQSRNYSPPPQ